MFLVVFQVDAELLVDILLLVLVLEHGVVIAHLTEQREGLTSVAGLHHI